MYYFKTTSKVFLALFFALTVSAATNLLADKYKLEQFIEPELCGDCHSEIYAQWENSMHHLAHYDPVYNDVARFFLQGLTEADEIIEAESCVKCHTPIGVETGYPKKLSDDMDKVPDIARQGVQCDYCHSVTGTEKPYNNGLTLAPGNGEDDPGTKRGPLKDAESDYHESAFSKFHTESELCGTCHNVKHVVFKTPLETTYEEWEKSPYNSSDPSKRITCQGCHMYQKPGVPATASTARPDNPGQAADDGPERDHIFTHNFVGGNGLVPGQFNGKDKILMAEERLKNAATLSLTTDKIDQQEFKIKITNTGAGHSLPTGLASVRQMWLEISVKDKAGQEIYSSGKLDKNGYLPEGAFLYNTIFGNGQGQAVLNVAKAREVLKDNRIPAQKSITETIKLPEGTSAQGLLIEVKLCYRSVAQKIVDAVYGNEKEKPGFPVIVMNSITKKI